MSNRTILALLIAWAALELVETALDNRRRLATLRAETIARLSADPHLRDRMQYAKDGEWNTGTPVKG